MIKHCFVKSPHQRNNAVFRKRKWRFQRTEQSRFTVDFQFHHLFYNNSLSPVAAELLYSEDVNGASYSVVLFVKDPTYQAKMNLSDITKTSELLELFRQRNNSNGMVISDLGQKRYHIGREQESVWELFSTETLEADDKAFMLKLRDTVRGVVEEARFQSVVDKLREAVGVPITGSVPKVIELTGERFGLNHTEQDGILQHLISGGDLSMYGLSNAITRASQDSESYDRATALESIGWQVATLPPDMWRSLNETR